MSDDIKVVDSWVTLNTPDFSGLFGIDAYGDIGKLVRREEEMRAGLAIEKIIDSLEKLGVERAIEEARKLPLKEESMIKFLRENALRVFNWS